MSTHTLYRQWAAVAASLVALAIHPNALATQQATGAVAEGARVYGATCGRCHNPRSPLERGDRDWIAIANHMRVRGNLTGEQVRDVLAFLQATNTDPRERAALTAPGAPARPAPARADRPVPTDPSTIELGRTLVADNACLGCHVVGDQGGQVGPGLNGVVGRRGAAFVRRKLADPTIDRATSMMPNFGLSEEQIEAIMAYLNTLDGGR